MVFELTTALAVLTGVGAVAGKAIVGLATKKALGEIGARLTKKAYRTQLDQALEEGIAGFVTRLHATTDLRERHVEALKTTFGGDEAAKTLEGLAYAWLRGVKTEALFSLLKKNCEKMLVSGIVPFEKSMYETFPICIASCQGSKAHLNLSVVVPIATPSLPVK